MKKHTNYNGKELLRSLMPGSVYVHYGKNVKELNSIKSQAYQVDCEASSDSDPYLHVPRYTYFEGNGERVYCIYIYVSTYGDKISGNDDGWSDEMYKDEDD